MPYPRDERCHSKEQCARCDGHDFPPGERVPSSWNTCVLLGCKACLMLLQGGAAVDLHPRTETGMYGRADRPAERVQMPRLAEQQSVEYGAFECPNSHRRQVQNEKPDVTRNQDQSVLVAHPRSRHEICNED